MDQLSTRHQRGLSRSPRLVAAGLHLALSLGVGGVLVLLVANVWYPHPFFTIASGRDIFLLVLGCDLTLGPLLTLVIFDLAKPRRELVRDVAIIASIQIAAMTYGLSTVLEGRPAFIVYNAGQFNVPLAGEILEAASPSHPSIAAPTSSPWFGPELVAVRLPADAEERNRLTFSAIEGRGDIFQMPQYFVPYQEAKAEVISRARSVAALASELHIPQGQVEALAAKYARPGLSTGLLPVVVRQKIALAVVDRATGALLGIEPLS